MAETNRQNNIALPVLSATEREELRQGLKDLKPNNEIVQRMIDAALRNVDEGVVPMTPEEIYEYLGRRS